MISVFLQMQMVLQEGLEVQASDLTTILAEEGSPDQNLTNKFWDETKKLDQRKFNTRLRPRKSGC